MAKENGVDLSTLTGSGPGGRIVKADVEGTPAAGPVAPTGAPAAEAAAAETAKGQTTYQDLSRLQQVIARRMAESKATAPHFYLQAEIDMSAAVEARARIKAMAAEGEVVPSFNDMVVKACALALRALPARQRRLQGRALRALLTGQRRRRRGRPGRPRRPHRLRRRPQGPAGDRRRHQVTGGKGAGRLDHAARALGRHLHRLQPRDVRDRRTSPP